MNIYSTIIHSGQVVEIVEYLSIDKWIDPIMQPSNGI